MIKIPKSAVMLTVMISGGCSYYPLPQDTTEDTTAAIISKFKCEAQQGLFLVTLKVIRSHGRDIVYRDGSLALNGHELAKKLELQEIYLTPNNLNKIIDHRLYDSLKYYKTATIGYEFTLDLQEVNNQGIGAGLTRTIPSPIIGISASAGVERTRQVQRAFRLVENFENLYPKSEKQFCDAAQSVDIIYPLRGANPVHDLIESFIIANEELGLSGTTDQSAVNRMADTIEFTTKLTSKFDPTITPAVIGSGLNLSSLAIVNRNDRTDRHKVIVSISVAPKKDKEIIQNGQVVTVNTRSENYRKTFAYETIDQQRTRNFQDAVERIGSSLSRSSFLFPF